MSFECQAAYDMLYLIGCALQKITPEKSWLRRMNYPSIYTIAKFHSVGVCVYEAIKETEDFNTRCPEKLQKEWKNEFDRAMYRDVMFDVERERIITYMEQNGIWYMPLKGIILKEYYPISGLRFMADNDILYDSTYQEKLHDFMVESGYEVEHYKIGHDDQYIKKPFYNFEMHVELFDRTYGGVMPDYYAHVKERLLKDEDNHFGYHFSHEDFFIYFLAHAYKHYEEFGGNGIRFLMDYFLYVKDMESKMDWSYINEELLKLNIEKFNRLCRKLAFGMFDNPQELDMDKMSEEERESLLYILQSGTFGIEEHIVKNAMKRQGENKSKGRYIWRRIFPDKVWLETYHPFVYKHKWLIPPFIMYRFIRGIFTKSGKVIREMRALRKMRG